MINKAVIVSYLTLSKYLKKLRVNELTKGNKVNPDINDRNQEYQEKTHENS